MTNALRLTPPFALALAAAAILTACSPISEGRITEKTHAEAYDSTYYTYQCMSYREDGTCAMDIPIPHTQRIPEKWGFDLSTGDKEGWVTVSEDTWNRYDVGDYYEKGGRGR